jgi:outer membrane receptor protein involved in Fe transport
LFDGFISGAVPARDRSLVNTQSLDRFTGGVTLNNTAFEWLTNRLTVGIDFTSEVNVQVREFQTNDTTIASLGSVGAQGFRNEGRRTHVQTTVDFSSTAEFDLTEAIATATSVGFQYYTRNTSFLNAGGDIFAGPGLSTVDATSVLDVPGNNDISDKTLGLYVQETLALNDRLFLTGAVRVDNHSAFGTDIEFVTYPKASLSWVITDEPWFGPSFLLSSLRRRGAWGRSGEQPAAFSALRTWAAVTGPLSSSGVSPNTVGNADLTAEVGEEIEVGFDADLLNARLGLQFSYYDKRTKDAILERDLAPSTGFTGEQFFNAGKIKNRGAEVQLNATFIDRPGFGLDASFSGSWNWAKIIQLTGQPGDTSIIFNSWSSMEHRVGYAPNSWFGVDVVSGDIDPATGRTVNAMCRDAVGGTTPCFDASGSTIAPRVYLGRAIAPYEASFTTDVRVGERFRFHAMFTSELGHKRFDNTLRQRCRLYRVCRVNYFPEEADDVALMAGIQSGNFIIDPWVNDVGFLKLKEVSVSYELPVSVFGVTRAVAQIAARNLLTFTNWTSSDPENMFSSGGRAFMQQNNMPLPQQITTTIRLSF